MKKILLLVCFSFIFFSSSFSQITFDKSLNEVSADIAGKLSEKNKKKIVVLYVTDINKAQTTAGKYMADVISVNIVNDQGNFEVFDRENLSEIVETKKMMAEGYIDANKAKELGRILAVDAIVIGNYTVLTATLKLTLKALDVNSGFVIAATMKDLPITADVGALLGITVGTVDNNANKGFNNRPLNSSESYNNPESVDKNCEINNKGDYCFQNNTKFLINVDLSGSKCTLKPGEVQCFYNANVGVFNYSLVAWKNNQPSRMPKASSYDYYAEGQVRIEKCKSKTFVIK
jgi:hypothetical protein